MLSPQDVTYFLAIARHLSLRAAAAELHITQPALSHSLKRLEGQLGAQLLSIVLRIRRRARAVAAAALVVSA